MGEQVKILLSFFILSLSFADTPSECQLNTNQATHRYQLPTPPSWFITLHPDGEHVGVIHDNNYVYRFPKDGEGEVMRTRVPGGVDPYFSPDGWLLAEPNILYDAEQIMSNLDNGIENSQSIDELGFANVNSVYQSIGVLDGEGDQREYMYIADPDPISKESPLAFARISAQRNEQGEKEIVNVDNGILCQGQWQEANTPVISRDGQYLSILNLETNSTQIYKVGAQADQCELMVDLGVPTGKVSFDYGQGSERKITFHIDQVNTNTSWFDSPSSEVIKDSYVMDISINNLGAENETWNVESYQRLTSTQTMGSGSYYPRFDQEGQIVLVREEEDEFGLPAFFLERYDPEAMTGITFDEQLFKANELGCEDRARNLFPELYALGSLYENICTNAPSETRFQDAILLAQSMTKENCLGLVENYWNDFNAEQASSLSLDELTASCLDFPSQSQLVHSPTLADFGGTQQDEAPQETLLRVCGGCHIAASMPYTKFIIQDEDGNLATEPTEVNGVEYPGLSSQTTLDSMNRILNRDQAFTPMPPGGAMHGSDELKVVEYLQEFYRTTGGDINDQRYKTLEAEIEERRNSQ
ncbi:MAG: hypothetical protein CME62_07095 [Halobacteriovoraceae bacterium]|nr:hypothetical protein [Halobacteriovoraceae bacterium]|tara:strand:- start:3253 stop:5010 length:1758 start_codon:yes stop_codon:yes gene_type:complete